MCNIRCFNPLSSYPGNVLSLAWHLLLVASYCNPLKILCSSFLSDWHDCQCFKNRTILRVLSLLIILTFIYSLLWQLFEWILQFYLLETESFQLPLYSTLLLSREEDYFFLFNNVCSMRDMLFKISKPSK